MLNSAINVINVLLILLTKRHSLSIMNHNWSMIYICCITFIPNTTQYIPNSILIPNTIVSNGFPNIISINYINWFSFVVFSSYMYLMYDFENIDIHCSSTAAIKVADMFIIIILT